jgi:hypothetical protein
MLHRVGRYKFADATEVLPDSCTPLTESEISPTSALAKIPIITHPGNSDSELFLSMEAGLGLLFLGRMTRDELSVNIPDPAWL